MADRSLLSSPAPAAAPVSVLLAASLFLAACGGSPAQSTTTTPSATVPTGFVIAEFQTDDGERYRVLL